MKTKKSKSKENNTHQAGSLSGKRKDATFFSALGIRPKLTIGEPDDKFEQEADQMADQVLSQEPTINKKVGGPNAIQTEREEEPEIRKKSVADQEEKEEHIRTKPEAPDEEKEKEVIQTKPASGLSTEEQDEPLRMAAQKTEMEEPEEQVRTKPVDEEVPEKDVQLKAGTDGASASTSLAAQLDQSKGNGSNLPETTNQFMSTAFGQDFSGVNIHTDDQSVKMNRELGARAFTHGSDVYFNAGEYDPASREGKKLLAHELTHVVQQGATETPSEIQRTIGDDHDLTSPQLAGSVPLEAAYDDESYVRIGARGQHVELLQKALMDLRYELPRYGVDGIFGPETKDAVQAFQRDNGLAVDGVVGPRTMEVLDKKSGGGGSVDPKEKPEISATAKDMGHHVASDMIRANEQTATEDLGIHYAHNYKRMYPHRWEDDYQNGYANPEYWQRIGFMDWVLKPGKSASAAVQDWLKGLTIAECLSTVVAIQIDTVRAAVGDAKFDKKYGSTETTTPEAKRLRIRPGLSGTILTEFLVSTEAAQTGNESTINNRPVNVGDWYYFYNHPKYLLKHPGGAFQGENSIYIGKDDDGNQSWSGLGLNKVTELEMYHDMAGDYNRPRDSWDLERLESIRIANGGVLPEQYQEGSGAFPDTIDWKDILTAPPYTINGTTRKGGFVVSTGTVLNPVKVQNVRDE